MKLQAIIFDCFGVLATDGLLPFREKYFGHNPELLQEARDRGKAVDAGLAAYEEYIAWLAQASGLGQNETRKLVENNVPDQRLFTYIAQELKPNYKIGMLSNAGANWLSAIFDPEQIALFDAVALSYETGFLKPAKESYAIIARKLAVLPEACVFLDDQERYAAAARDAGMQAIHYRTFEQGKRDLGKLLSQS